MTKCSSDHVASSLLSPLLRRPPSPRSCCPWPITPGKPGPSLPSKSFFLEPFLLGTLRLPLRLPHTRAHSCSQKGQLSSSMETMIPNPDRSWPGLLREHMLNLLRFGCGGGQRCSRTKGTDESAEDPSTTSKHMPYSREGNNVGELLLHLYFEVCFPQRKGNYVLPWKK